MSTGTKIEWTDATWNPTTGCDQVSAGCDNCYAARIAARFGRPFYGAVEVHEDRLDQPLRWRKPRRVFVNSVSDLFHPDIPADFVAQVFAVMSRADVHTFQVLTKRPQLMQRMLSTPDFVRAVDDHRGAEAGDFVWPLPNVWLGVSVESQRYADLRIPHLLTTPAAVRFISAEPLLGPVDVREFLPGLVDRIRRRTSAASPSPTLGWVIVGGESGPGARPMSPWWARDLRDQCIAAEVPLFFKQWGEFAPAVEVDADTIEGRTEVLVDQEYVVRVGKGRAGRTMEGRTWDEYPA